MDYLGWTQDMDGILSKVDRPLDETLESGCYSFSFFPFFLLWTYHFSFYIWIQCHMVTYVTHFNSSYL